GIKIYCRGKSPFATGRKIGVNVPRIVEKAPGVELYDHVRYFAMTGWRVKTSHAVEERQEQVNWFAAKFWPAEPGPRPSHDFRSDVAVYQRARAYVARLPPAISGQGGHNACFHVACVLVLGFGLSEPAALQILTEYSSICQPPWSDREL